jgi:hypothetical protein
LQNLKDTLSAGLRLLDVGRHTETVEAWNSQRTQQTRRYKMSRAKLNGLFSLAREMRKAGAISSSEYQRIMDYLKKLSQKIGG